MRICVDPTNSDLQDGEKQARLRKWLPLLWIPPVVLILLLALVAYFGR
jgi:hypothetical protein